MHQEIKKYPLDFAILFISFLVVLAFFFHFRFSFSLEQRLLFSLVGFYLVWGLVHHWRHSDLTVRVVGEYLLFAFLALLLGWTVFRWG